MVMQLLDPRSEPSHFACVRHVFAAAGDYRCAPQGKRADRARRRWSTTSELLVLPFMTAATAVSGMITGLQLRQTCRCGWLHLGGHRETKNGMGQRPLSKSPAPLRGLRDLGKF